MEIKIKTYKKLYTRKLLKEQKLFFCFKKSLIGKIVKISRCSFKKIQKRTILTEQNTLMLFLQFLFILCLIRVCTATIKFYAKRFKNVFFCIFFSFFSPKFNVYGNNLFQKCS